MSNIPYNTPEYVKNGIGRPPRFKTPEELEAVFLEYLDYCREHEEPLTMTGAALYCGTYRDYLWRLEQEKPEFHDIIKRIRESVANSYEKGGILGKINAAQAIFLQKNAGFTDKQEIDMHHSGSVDFGNVFGDIKNG